MVVDHAIDDENVDPIARVGFHAYGVTLAKKYPPYVFSIRGVSCLVHKVQCVELHWWRIAGHGDKLVKMKRPVMVARTCCSTWFMLMPTTARTCRIPAPDALLCGRCHGEGASFPKRANGKDYKHGLTRSEAHVKLGCVVQGY